MSRSDVLVDADWVEAHIDDPTVALVEVDEDTSAYEMLRSLVGSEMCIRDSTPMV